AARAAPPGAPARGRAAATLAAARAEAEQLRSGLDEERRRGREEVAAEVRAETAELRERVERLLGDIGGSLGDLGSLLSGARSTVEQVQRTAEGLTLAGSELDEATAPAVPVAVEPEREPAPEPEVEPEPEAVEPEPEPVASEPAEDREPVVEQRDSLYAVTALHGSVERDREPEPSVEGERSTTPDDLEEAPSDPRPLGWLFRGH
ncbi:MAG: hypothetical protein ABF306_15090, partial [Nocardioides marinisabuli]|uniref:hypothetical protein n=1 Tax=Nocardioides marinisabuli TaxID=419476 RepID=UPI00321A76FC